LQEKLKKLIERKIRRKEYPVRIKAIVLSGGGAKGAYGAGFLNGLTAGASQLDYNVVTGISTGSIQSTFVFLGPQHYPTLKQIYHDEQWDRFVPKKSVFSLAFCGNSLKKNDGFKLKLKEYITDEIIDEVKQKAESEETLFFVGTVDLDTGLFRRWDMVEIAKRGLYDLYRDVILASCAIPIVFPPVELPYDIDDRSIQGLHVDGGARHIAFLNSIVADVRIAIEPYTKDPKSAIDPFIDIIINDTLIPEEDCTKNTLLGIAERSVTAVMKQTIENDIYSIYATSCAYDIPLRITFMEKRPDGFADDFYAGMQSHMRTIYENGRRKAGHTGWYSNDRLPTGESWEVLKMLCNP
jgi:hypothetical protein